MPVSKTLWDMGLKTLICVTSLSLIGMVEAGETASPKGPLRLAEINPLYTLTYTPRAEAAPTIGPGRWRLDLGTSYSNIFERETSETHIQNLDFELMTQYLNVRRGLGTRFEVGTQLIWRSTSGGFLDHFIQEYHGLFGLPNDNRDEVPNDAFSFLFGPRDQAPSYQTGKRRFAFGEPVIFAKYQAIHQRERGFDLSFKTAVKLPWGASNQGGDGTDVSLEGIFSKSFEKYHIHGMLAWAHIDPHADLQAQMRQNGIFGSFALERTFRVRHALIAQLDLGSQLFRDTGLDNLDDAAINFSVGWAGSLSGGWAMQIGFMEDLTGNGPAVDFTLDVQVSKVF
ncbi:DUF3187 domain-containing protein [Sulfidibacter corallicola]|uniref:DUF3187 family protein n=1 Tax=Sulfidibacter corallicola TaxID=2818388 RepID=A0A8A4TX73_SULCO|nr:DUF3187 family protein [Sulfidibacter corallicola]QTD54073.1 DUF3187 family protein [Sulfidibacter corallicola]